MAALSRAASDSCHAKGAFVVAAILYFYERPRIAHLAAASQKLAQDRLLFIHRQINPRLRIEGLNQFVFVLIDDNAAGPFDLAYFLRGDGGVAAGEDDFGIFVGTVDAPGHIAGVAGSLGGDGAGVDDDFFGLSRVIDQFVTGSQKLAAHCFDLALVEATADGVQENFHGHDCSVEGGKVAKWGRTLVVAHNRAGTRPRPYFAYKLHSACTTFADLISRIKAVLKKKSIHRLHRFHRFCRFV